MNLLLSSSNNLMQKVLIVIAIVGALAVIFALLIVLVSKLCVVEVDEKVEAIQEKLAGANCGGCGYAGCADYAKALSKGKANLKDCGATSNESKEEIAKILGIPFSAEVPVFAVVHCAGGKQALNKFNYVGNEGCIAQTASLGGKKVCNAGCLGEGTCKSLCPFNAIVIKDEVAIIDKALCESCGVCVNACPKNIISFIPRSAKVFIACSTNCKGKEVLNACKVGCIACGMCAKVCPNEAITMVNNLATIDYNKCTACKNCVEKCPTKCIKEI